MKTRILTLILVCLLILSSGCHKKPAEPVPAEPSVPDQQEAPVPADTEPSDDEVPSDEPPAYALETEQDEIKEGEDLLLRYSVSTLRLDGEEYADLNALLAEGQDKILRLIKDEYIPQAQQDRASCVEDGRDFVPYGIESEDTVTYLSKTLLSAQTLGSYFTGGAHPNAVLTSYTYTLPEGRLLTLDDIFTVPSDEYLPMIFEHVRSSIQAPGAEIDPSMFYEDYDEQIELCFNTDNFYLEEDALVVYYEPYDIAPYAAGILTFEIPFREIRSMLSPEVI